MTQKDTMLDEWRKLYDAAQAIKKLKPWEWMEEIDMFGVQNPDDGTIGFVSIMGMLGEYYAVGVYLGERALDGFWAMQDAGPDAPPEALLELPQLQASFTSREDIEKEDYEIIKKLGLKFRGKNAWPQFRSIHPAHLPWFLEDSEVRFLRQILEQTIDVVTRFKHDESVLEPPDDASYLIRVPHKQETGLRWEDQMQQVSVPEDLEVDLAMEANVLDALKALPQSQLIIECDLFMLPTPVMEGGRPFFPYVLLAVETESQMMVAADMLSPNPSLEAMWGLTVNSLMKQVVKAGFRPQEIKVASDFMYSLLEAVTDEIGVNLRRSRRMKGLEEAKASMFEHMMNMYPDDLM